MLQWLNEENWTQGSAAIDASGNDVYYFSPNAEKFDLTSAIKVSTDDFDRQQEAFDKIRKLYKIKYPERFKKAEDFYKKDGKMHIVYPLYKLNDMFHSFSELKNLLVLIDI